MRPDNQLVVEDVADQAVPGASPFRWVMLAIVFLGEVAQGLLWLSAVPLVLSVEHDLHLTASKIAIWVNLRLMASFLFSIVVGLLADSWGTKRVCRIGFLLLAGGALARGFASSYSVLLTTSAVYALGATVLAISLPKAFAMWFPRNEMGRASGIYLSGYGLGACLALGVVHPLFGDNWQRCFRAIGFIGVAAAACWWLFAKEPPGVVRPNSLAEQWRQAASAFKKAARSSVTWLLTGIFLFYAASYTTWFTFGFPFLVRFRNLNQSYAGVILMLTMLGYIVAALSMPALSDRLGYRRPFLLFYSILAALLFLSLLYWRAAVSIEIAAFFIGSLFGTANPLIFTIAAEADELGPAVMGGAIGIITSVSSIAGFLVPTLTGKFLGSLSTATQHRFHIVLILAACYMAGIFICAALMRETGLKRGTRAIIVNSAARAQ
jgi:ACS family hexuronate transporter-like MFS transporter